MLFRLFVTFRTLDIGFSSAPYIRYCTLRDGKCTVIRVKELCWLCDQNYVGMRVWSDLCSEDEHSLKRGWSATVGSGVMLKFWSWPCGQFWVFHRLFCHCFLYSLSSSPWSNRLERGLPKLMRATPVTGWSIPSIRIPSDHHDRQYLLSLRVQKGSFLDDRRQFAEWKFGCFKSPATDRVSAC